MPVVFTTTRYYCSCGVSYLVYIIYSSSIIVALGVDIIFSVTTAVAAFVVLCFSPTVFVLCSRCWWRCWCNGVGVVGGAGVGVGVGVGDGFSDGVGAGGGVDVGIVLTLVKLVLLALLVLLPLLLLSFCCCGCCVPTPEAFLDPCILYPFIFFPFFRHFISVLPFQFDDFRFFNSGFRIAPP